MGVLAWMGASTVQLQLQSAALAQNVSETSPRLQALTLALCCFCCGSGKTGKRAQRPIQRCCHLLPAVNQSHHACPRDSISTPQYKRSKHRHAPTPKTGHGLDPDASFTIRGAQ